MPTGISRSLAGLLVMGAVAVAGHPDSTALERAVSKIFAAPIGRAAPAPEDDGPSVFDAPQTAIGALILPDFSSLEAPLRPATAERALAGVPAPDRRGRGILVPLYASFLSLQVLDVHSTLRAVHRGATETNPLMAPFADQPAALVALKAGTAAGILYMTERVRRHSPLTAIVMMAAFNSVYATVVANNYRLGNQR